MRTQAPDIVNEWVIRDPGERELARQHLRDYGLFVPRDAGVATIGPLTIRQLNLFAHEAVLALHFEHAKEPLPTAGRVCAYWKSKEDFAHTGIPSDLLQLLPNFATLIQGQWDERETFAYRHASNPEHGLFGCLAKLRRGLFIVGFTVTDAVTAAKAMDADWMLPEDPWVLLQAPRFLQKL
jgi:hypothetical protein